MVNELSATATPELAPPSEEQAVKVKHPAISPEPARTPDSISSSIGEYSPVVPAVAHCETYTNNTSKSELESFEIPSNSNTAVENDAPESSFVSLSSNTSIKTFSSDDDEDYTNGTKAGGDNDDSDIFEKFNGSTKDLASPAHKRAIEFDNKNSTFSLQIDKIRFDNSSNTRSSYGSGSGNNNDLNAPLTPLTPMMEEENKEDFKHDLKYRNLSRNITPFTAKHGVSERAMISRIQDLESQSNELDTKYLKLEREIAYIEEMLSGLKYNGLEPEITCSVEIRKLLYAKGKLEERLQDAKKKRYDVGVTLIKLRRSLYGDNSGDMTEYFARNVSN